MKSRKRIASTVALTSAAYILLSALLPAATVTFATDPFAGSTALTTAGRQVVGNNEVSLPTFNTTADLFAFDQAVFTLGAGPLTFTSSLAASLVDGSYDIIILRDTDNDNNIATAFNAAGAANLIAAAINQPGDGFFVYWNSSLNVNRLVYSTDLSDPAADLSILARIVSPTGQAAINELPNFTSANLAAVPEPSSALLGVIASLGLLRRRRC